MYLSGIDRAPELICQAHVTFYMIANSTKPDEFEMVRAEPLTRASSASAVTEQPSAEALTALWYLFEQRLQMAF